MWSYKRDGRSWGIRIRTEPTVRHNKCGRMRGMVVGEGGRSSGVLLYRHISVRSNLDVLPVLTQLLNFNCRIRKLSRAAATPVTGRSRREWTSRSWWTSFHSTQQRAPLVAATRTERRSVNRSWRACEAVIGCRRYPWPYGRTQRQTYPGIGRGSFYGFDLNWVTIVIVYVLKKNNS